MMAEFSINVNALNKNFLRVTVPRGPTFFVPADEIASKAPFVTVYAEAFSTGKLVPFIKISADKKPKAKSWRNFVVQQLQVSLSYIKSRDKYKNSPVELIGEPKLSAADERQLFTLNQSPQQRAIIDAPAGENRVVRQKIKGWV